MPHACACHLDYHHVQDLQHPSSRRLHNWQIVLLLLLTIALPQRQQWVGSLQVFNNRKQPKAAMWQTLAT
jgi:hypothetical protein